MDILFFFVPLYLQDFSRKKRPVRENVATVHLSAPPQSLKPRILSNLPKGGLFNCPGKLQKHQNGKIETVCVKKKINKHKLYSTHKSTRVFLKKYYNISISNNKHVHFKLSIPWIMCSTKLLLTTHIQYIIQRGAWIWATVGFKQPKLGGQRRNLHDQLSFGIFALMELRTANPPRLPESCDKKQPGSGYGCMMMHACYSYISQPMISNYEFK